MELVMKITKRQLRRIITEELANEQADPRAMELETLINSWIPRPITVELVRGITYTVKGIEPAMVPEVTEEVEDFGGTVRAETTSSTSPGRKDLNIDLGR